MEAPDSLSTVQRTWHAGPLVALIVLILIWSYAWIVVKVGLRYSEPLTFAALRNLLGAVTLLTIMWLSRRSLRPRALRMTLLVGLLQTTGFFGLSVWALETGGAGRVTVLTYTMPFWLLFMAWAFLGERLHGLQWLAVTLAFAGLILILAPWQLRGVTSSLLAIGSGLCWAGSAVAAKLLHRRHRVDLLSLTAWQLFLGSLPLALLALLTATELPDWSWSFIWALLFTTLGATALGQFLWLYILRAVPAGYAGLSTLAVPVITLFLAWLQLGEQPTGLEALGIALIVAALAIITANGIVQARRATPGLVAPSRQSGRGETAAPEPAVPPASAATQALVAAERRHARDTQS